MQEMKNIKVEDIQVLDVDLENQRIKLKISGKLYEFDLIESNIKNTKKIHYADNMQPIFYNIETGKIKDMYDLYHK